MTEFSRRHFLKLLGLAGTGSLAGCSSESFGVRLPYIDPPESIIPGVPSWFATTCRECPAGCGMLGKNRDGRVIKLEGNPENPLNRGVLCPRGQASLTHLYNPDRIQTPLRKTPSGFVAMTWPEAENVLAGELRNAAEKRSPGRVVFMTELITGPLQTLVRNWISLAKGRHIRFEPFGYEPLMKANELVFRRNVIPAYRIDQADFLISFNAGFLETWLSNIEYARQFAAFHEPKAGSKNLFLFVGPRQSLTAANADIQFRVAPGNEYLVGIALLLALSENAGAGDDGDVKRILSRYSLAETTRLSGVPVETIRSISRRFSEASRPLALAEGLSRFSPHGFPAAVAANLLNTRKPGTRELIQWSRASTQGELTPEVELKAIFNQMGSGQIDLLLIQGTNPVFSLPSSWNLPEAIEAVPSVISFSSFMDETTALADYILPTHTFLESWGEFSPKTGVTGIIQPVMGHLYDTMPLGDLLIRSGRATYGRERFPWKNFHELLLVSWQERWEKSGSDQPFPLFWAQALQRGGLYLEPADQKTESDVRGIETFPSPEPARTERSVNQYHFIAYPSIQFYDGRMADTPWIQELPDPITQITWSGWVEIHPETAKRLGIEKGDLLELRSDSGNLSIPARPIYSVHPDTVAVPLGQGHTIYGRFASGLPGNPMVLYPQNEAGEAWPIAVTLKKTGASYPIANTDGSFFVHGRQILKKASLETYRNDLSSGARPNITVPLPEGWDRKVDFYDAHIHSEYRWAMVVDLDRCIGCGACVVACYAENNVAIVGKEQVLKGREMSWLRVQRYFDEGDHRAHWLVMLCQHCDSAPCESVCPIYAPQHSVDGLNNQVYNRCFGTRFCSQNDPYKVRRFNWFTWERPWPLDLQLNPDVTVRQKGVMEKCSFCIQRITDAKLRAREKGRLVQDGDFTTACAQTCPTNALIFGNLKNPESRVSRLIQNPRAYQVLHHLNTKPAVIYLMRIEQQGI